MKKTLTVNLNNIVFHIDDDAYDMLQTYLSEIAEHFMSEDERKEIMNDIEARIAELFTEKLQKNKNVVNLTDVQEIIEIMGKPSQYAGDEEETEKPKQDKNQQKTRRYYRDPENAVLGGVAAGLAAYFGWDVTLVRVVIAIFALITSGVAIPIYIIVWLVAPQALTASQRLEMQGEDVTVESIKTELNNVKNYMESEKFKESATSIGERMMDIFKLFFKVVFGFVGAVLGIVGVVLIGALIMLLFFLIFEPTVINGFAPDIVTNCSVITPEKMVMLIISLILVVGCPIFLLIYWAIRIVSGRQNSSQTASWVVLILWLAGLFMFYSVGANTFIRLQNTEGHRFSFNWTDNDSPLVDEVRNCEPFNSVDVSGNIELILTQDSVQQVTISSPSDYLPKVITKVENGTLKIYSEQIFLNRTIKVNISSNSLIGLEASGATKIETINQLVAPEFTVELTGASKADMDLNVLGDFNVQIKGASKMDLKGTCESFKVKGSGASKINAKDLIAKNVDINVSGANHSNVYASDNITIDASGASEIVYSGNPKNVKQSNHIGSNIRKE